MRAVIQRVSQASVSVEGEKISAIGPGLLVLLGIQVGDTEADAAWLAEKTANLRIFPDADGKMNVSLRDTCVPASAPPFPTACAPSLSPEGGGAALVVSQFTLIASTRKGTRPSFNDAARPDVAIPLYEAFVRHVETALGRPVATGRFGAMMGVSLVNDGPVTLIIDSRDRE